MIEAIAKRKSIRNFADKKVEPEKIESLLCAVSAAHFFNSKNFFKIFLENSEPVELSMCLIIIRTQRRQI